MSVCVIIIELRERGRRIYDYIYELVQLLECLHNYINATIMYAINAHKLARAAL